MRGWLPGSNEPHIPALVRLAQYLSDTRADMVDERLDNLLLLSDTHLPNDTMTSRKSQHKFSTCAEKKEEHSGSHSS